MKHFLVVGGTGVGKSSTINALAGRRLAPVGYESEPKTQKLIGYKASGYTLWDSPGLGDGVMEDKRHVEVTSKFINENSKFPVYHVLLIIEASKRDFGGVIKVVESFIKPEYESRFSVLLNQADQAMKGQNWDATRNEPTPVLLNFLEEQVITTRNRLAESTDLNVPKPLFYSAQKGYRVPELHNYIEGVCLNGCGHQ